MRESHLPLLAVQSRGTGDSRAHFLDVYRREHAYVLGIVRRLGVLPADAEDVVQNVFLVLHSRLHELDRSASVRLWLRAVAVRVSSNYRRSVSRRRLDCWREQDKLETDDLVDSQQEPPDESVAQNEQRLLLVRAIQALDTKKREVWILSALEGRTAGEIAKLIQISPNTVASRLRAAQSQLTKSMLAATRGRRAGVKSSCAADTRRLHKG